MLCPFSPLVRLSNGSKGTQLVSGGDGGVNLLSQGASWTAF